MIDIYTITSIYKTIIAMSLLRLHCQYIQKACIVRNIVGTMWRDRQSDCNTTIKDVRTLIQAPMVAGMITLERTHLGSLLTLAG